MPADHGLDVNPNSSPSSSRWVGNPLQNNPTVLGNAQFLRVQAEGDTTVTPDQACELASKLPGSVNYYLNSLITPLGAGVYYGRPKECSGFSMPWMNYPHRSKSRRSFLPTRVAGHVVVADSAHVQQARSCNYYG